MRYFFCFVLLTGACFASNLPPKRTKKAKRVKKVKKVVKKKKMNHMEVVKWQNNQN